MVLRIARTVSTGYLPLAVSSDNITTSAPWITAFATSLTSARLGSGLSTILPIICVATITSLQYLRHKAIIRRCTTGTISAPASTAKSPRATIIPSLALTISSRFSGSTADLVSILAIILAVEPRSVNRRRKSIMSSAF